MYKQCRTEQSARRQQEIEEGLLSMMLQRRYEDVSVSDLCDRLGVPRKAFYRYFSGKEGALQALVDHRLLEYEVYTGSRNLILGDRQGLTVFFEFWITQKKLLDALSRSGLTGILVERAIRHSQEAHLLNFYSDMDSEEYTNLATAFTVCGLMTVVIQWHHEGYQSSAQEMAGMAYKMLGRPLVPGLDV